MKIISPAKLHRETIASSMVTFPEELIAEVLSLLKVKSLLRFKCVNKSWNSLISDPFFVEMHLIESSQNPHMIFSPTHFLSTSNIGLHNPFMMRSLLENPSINLFPNDSKYKLIEKCTHIIGSCNGLACLVSPSYCETEFYLWNPATRWLSQKLASFHNDYSKVWFNFSFGYDNLTGKYKVVAFRCDEKVRVLTLGDNVWRNIRRFPTYPYECNDIYNVGVYLNNSLNWFALSNKKCVIISFDLGIETYTKFLFPPDFDKVKVVCPIVCVLMERICFSHYSVGGNFVIWQMKEFGVRESWTKLLKFDYQSTLQSNFHRVINLLPLHVFENGDMLIFALNLKQVICYNSKENRVVRQATVTNSPLICRFSVIHYVESLLSMQ